MYTTAEGVIVGSILFADNNLSPTKRHAIEELELFREIYD